MKTIILLSLITANNIFSGNAGYNINTWNGWPGNGIKAEVGYGLAKDRLGAGVNIGFSNYSFSKGDSKFAFNNIYFSLAPYYFISSKLPIKVGPFVDYNIINGTYQSDVVSSFKIDSLNFIGYGFNANYLIPVNKKVNLSLGCQLKTISGFKNLYIATIGAGFEYKPKYDAPSVIASLQFDDSRQNSNNRLDADETTELLLNISNAGPGTAEGVKANFEVNSNEHLGRLELPSIVNIGIIKPNETKTIPVKIKALSNIPDGTLLISYRINSRWQYESGSSIYISTKRGDKPYLAVNAQPHDDNGNGVFEAGEEVGFKARVSNTGRGEAYKVGIAVKDQLGRTVTELSLGSINPAGEQNVDLAFQMPLDAKNGQTEFQIVLTEASGYAPSPQPVQVETGQAAAVSLSADVLVDDDKISPSQGNSDGAIDKGETIELKCQVRNDGASTAKGVTARLVVDQGGIELANPKAVLGNIEPGGSKEGTVVFIVKQYFSEPVLNMSLVLSENTEKFTKTIPLSFPLGQPMAIAANAKPKYPKRKNTFALLIGIGKYENNSISRLNYAEKDMADMERVLNENGFDYVWSLRGKDATLSKIKTYLINIEDAVGPDGSVFIFFSGHGAPCQSPKDKRGPYLCPYEVDKSSPRALQTTSLSWDDLLNSINKMNAPVYCAINACYSFVTVEGAAPIVPAPVLNPGQVIGNKVIVSATDWDQQAFEVPEYQHSVFAYHLLEAFSGKADKNKDNWIDSDESYEWIKTNVNESTLKLKKTKQNPQKMGNGKIQLIRVK